ncbi:MAG TPA: hypothetical protein VLA34_03210, partial [Candidatus Krumholzibacterium sp.]|nr:hypothetical protein [Candidatus Krumholzibacterium sp.]
MFEKNKSLLLAFAIIATSVLVLQTGCARTGTGNIVPTGGGEPKTPAASPDQGVETVLADEDLSPAAEVYDLEDESLVEDEIVDATEKVEGVAD